MKVQSEIKQEKTQNAEKPISLAPLSITEAFRALLQVKPVKGETLKKASKKRTAKKNRGYQWLTPGKTNSITATT